MRHMFLAALWVVAAGPTLAATLQVGPGRTYTSLQQVVEIVNPGDVVEVDGNVTYAGGVTFTRAGTAAQPITIRGLRERAAKHCQHQRGNATPHGSSFAMACPSPPR